MCLQKTNNNVVYTVCTKERIGGVYKAKNNTDYMIELLLS